MHPRVADWFARTYPDFTPAQRLCIPAILEGKSVLLSSPTGSGKTLAGFLGIIDWLVRNERAAGCIYGIYVSPLRALTYDIQKNLNRPLLEMGLEGKIRVGLRTGDTSAKERASIRRKPPHLLLTTPESLAILLCQPAYHAALRTVRFIVVDELHALAENKRGTHLSISLERLERLKGREPVGESERMPVVLRKVGGGPEDRIVIGGVQDRAADESRVGSLVSSEQGSAGAASADEPLCRIGLSATISPLETMAGFLVGVGRPCLIAEAKMQRRTVIEVFSPVRKEPYPPAGLSAARVVHELAALVRTRRSVLVFTNTRAGAEKFGLQLKAALPKLAAQVEVHHGSLDRNLRLDVEDRLKNGELRAVVCSTSLEMGVDIGAIDLVVMISSPKGISRTLQRIGRSGHAVDATSHGILVATNVSDLLECAVTARMARERKLDPVRVPENAADVLAQHIVGMTLELPGMPAEEAWATVRGAWPYRNLQREDFDRVLEYLGGGGRSLEKAYADTFGKVGMAEGRMYAATPRVGRDYLVNVGTIASEGMVDVMLRRRRLGVVDEGFIKGLKKGDVFVLGGRVVKLVEAGYQVAKVEAADGERPNVPKWSANRMALTSGLAEEIGRLRTGLDQRMERAEGGRNQDLRKQESKNPRNQETKEGSGFKVQGRAAGEGRAMKGGGLIARHRKAYTEVENGVVAATDEVGPAGEESPVDWLVERWEFSLANAQAVAAHFRLQRRFSVVPRDGMFLIEHHRDRGDERLSHYFFHSLIGRGANDALSRIVARRVARLAGGNAVVMVDDYSFMLTLSRFQELTLAQWRRCFAREGAEADLREALKESELVRWQFRSVAQTGLMVPRQLPGKERKLKQLRFSAEILFRVLEQHEPDHPMLVETYRQALTRFLDVEGACVFMERAAGGGLEWNLVETPTVSPFAFALYAIQRKEVLMFEEPEEAVERMYREFYGGAGEDGKDAGCRMQDAGCRMQDAG